MPTSEFSRGVFASDIVLRDAILRGIAYLRARPYRVDDIFHTMVDDDETAGIYGPAQAAEAKRWFLHTDIPVRIADAMEPPVGTGLTLALGDGSEDALTLGDVHYQTTDGDERVWESLAGPLDPASYDAATGTLVLPEGEGLVVAAGMVVVDREGRILPVVDAPAPRVVQLAPGTRADLRGMTIRGMQPARAVSLRSLVEQESYILTAAVVGESVHLAYLFAIVKYVLYRARQQLETRGMERVRYSTSGPQRDGGMGPEVFWTRYVTISLCVRQTWVQDEEERIYTVDEEITAGAVGAPDFDADVLSGAS